MKYSYYIILFCTFLFASACKKTISDDTPLPTEYLPNILVPTSNGILYSYNASSGKKIWEYNTNSTIDCTPVADYSENIYFGCSGNSSFYAIDGKTGLKKWQLYLNGYSTSSPCFDGTNIYVGCDSLYCLNNLGTKLWYISLEGNNIKTAPTFANGNVFVSTRQKIYSVNTNTKTWDWVYNAGSSEFRSSPTVRDGKVYCGLIDGRVVCLNQTTGALIWTYTCKDDVYSTPMVRGDMCIVGSYDDTIRCIDAVAGTDAFRWKVRTAERVSSSATIDVDRETVYIGSNDFNMYAINHVTGELRWKFPTGSIIKCSPVLYDNKIYFTSYDKYLYCVSVVDGKLVWKVNINSVNEGLCSPIINAKQTFGFYPTVSGNSLH